jgi:hypothetical protein
MQPATMPVMAFMLRSLPFFWLFGNTKFHCGEFVVVCTACDQVQGGWWPTAETAWNCQGANGFRSIAFAIA